MTFLLSIIIGIFILGIMVLIHELGHFIAAKACKIRVLAFSIGFGKVLLKKEHNGTEYRLSAIPFGGYVKMAGEHADDEHTGAADEFPSRPKWQRALVAVAGPVANYLSAILMLWVMFMYGVDHAKYLDRPLIGYVADSSAARAAGIMAGDSIVSMNGKSVNRWEDLENQFLIGSSKYEVLLVRNGEVRHCLVSKDPKKGEQYAQPPFGMLPALPAVVGKVNDTLPAARAGIKAGDTLLSIDTFKICSWYQISAIIQNGDTGMARQVTVSRQGAVMTMGVAPRFDAKLKRFVLGIEMSKAETYKAHYPPVKAIKLCLAKTWDFTTMIFQVLGKLISREVSAKELAGPVGIIPASGIIALQGLGPILNFMALISINLAVLNLFPLVITDGGVLLFLLLEAIRRRPLSIKTQLAITRFAIAFFIVFFLYVTLNDITRMPMLFRMFGK
jgi:regulator of sigma E protease